MTPGTNIVKTVYLKNSGNIPLTLNMTTLDWNPQNANGPITITWNREGTTLNPGNTISATLTLTISPNITGITTFSVTVRIKSTG